MKFTITNNVSKKSITKTVEDIGDSTLYYHFNYSLDELTYEGEWSYFLYDDEDNLLAQGLLQIGDYQVPSGSTTIYNNNPKTEYIQYYG